ncbi:hypothetical protein FHT86_007678 [Rhizobium sp. BK313]|uniref:hypothetical protein n=1 Tax=Rhizobium sp. BK313 TaxID=2587081 RepID=UPI00106162EE|nr:hypothetical protein [Rhizobium sp. BK313]MBB3459346.1 hypothetical protein [Rhizobium sp. BK313]
MDVLFCGDLLALIDLRLNARGGKSYHGCQNDSPNSGSLHASPPPFFVLYGFDEEAAPASPALFVIAGA